MKLSIISKSILIGANVLVKRKNFYKIISSSLKTHAKMSKVELSEIRKKPFIVVCGCTGTGKTKLSIQLAEWLISNGKRAEIINADAMQLYKDLDIITNKATHEEMKGIKHHLIGYLDSTSISNLIVDYKHKAVQLIDNMLEDDIVPILVGGTHYYIQSVIWDVLIDSPNVIDDKQTQTTSAKNDIFKSNENESEIVKLIIECMNKVKESSSINSEPMVDDLNVKLHDSNIPTEDIYKQLELIDPQSAQKIHPNERRKLCRALQIYYNHGITKSELLDMKLKQEGTNQPMRYKNTCMFVLNCETETLNKRLDERVDQMVLNGLLDEIKKFKIDFQNKFPGQTFKDYSRDFEFGIFQSIGFKEFDEYLNHLENAKESDPDYEIQKEKLLNKGLSEMKISTRRYAKIQIRWVKNRFIKRADQGSPIIHELDTTNLEKWTENIYDKAKNTFNDYLVRFEEDQNADLNKKSDNIGSFGKQEEIFEYNKCESCEKVFINKFQWDCHIKGSKHKKRVEKLKRQEKLKAYKMKQNDESEEAKKSTVDEN